MFRLSILLITLTICINAIGATDGCPSTPPSGARSPWAATEITVTPRVTVYTEIAAALDLDGLQRMYVREDSILAGLNNLDAHHVITIYDRATRRSDAPTLIGIAVATNQPGYPEVMPLGTNISLVDAADAREYTIEDTNHSIIVEYHYTTNPMYALTVPWTNKEIQAAVLAALIGDCQNLTPILVSVPKEIERQYGF